ncbi:MULTISPECIES: tripartite tricarboxylate transporter substrate binding protein [unclassified Beijerinckia]|uniref:Bug family tripartite tricarboxylate transporter substrate binding protein n=1 Tax=unclassified Beijerinckia TaxID=2638183 RepID=UPI00089C6985|nr:MULTISPECIES: tripartite tricarboxylate transporter substrate binding protein [unclassified Beijerinckia]MDH7796872.1 tripartite-type tricarboxylate transporter receptor subunit TctC [Beijerinckia sp. GAS462]SEC63177.1 Tripartite-type tricarboxylate transporter, receptor component TctC [Beijerinckia sp. 28-YEA-48]
MRSIAVPFAALLALVAPSSLSAQTEAWPSGTVKFIVPFAAGASPDIIARIVGEKLQQRTGKPFIIENRPGASGNTGTDVVARAPGDGMTIGISLFGPMGMNTVLMKSMPYDPFKDIAPVTMLTSQPSVLAVSNELGVNTVGELIALLKKNPGKYNYASIGRGSLSHLAMELIAAKSGTEVVHVVFGGSPQAAQAVMQNDVQMTVLPAVSVVPLASDGKMKILAVTEPKRSKFLPNVPTFAEAGIDGVEASAWNALIAPPSTPPAILDEIYKQTAAAINEPDVIAKLAAQMIEVRTSTPKEMAQFVRDEMTRWGVVVKAAKIEPQ